MSNVDYWHHNTDVTYDGEIHPDAIKVHTDNIPNLEFPVAEGPEGLIYKQHPDTRDFFPCVNERRVSGNRFTPYKTGSDLWREAANQLLASMANNNFNRY